MSKKSRRRNKKILGLLAAGLGAAALAKRRKATALNAITAGDIADTGTLSGKAGFEGDVPSAAPGANKVIAAPVDTDAAVDTGSQTRFTKFVDGKWRGPNEIAMARAATPGHGTAVAPPGILNPYKHRPTRRYRAKGGSAYKSGGRVTGIAKRGFGRALKKK